MDDYYIRLLRLLPKRVFAFQQRKILVDEFPTSNAALVALRRSPEGTYLLQVYWGGKLFDEINIDFRNSKLQWQGYNVTCYHDIVEITLAKAILCNSLYDKERKEKATNYLLSMLPGKVR